MEHVIELLYQGMAVLLFCIAVSLLFWLFYNLDKMEQEAKKNIYQEHILYSNQN